MSQKLCHSCGSLYIGTGIVCRVCKAKGLKPEDRPLNPLPNVEVPEELRVGLYITTMNKWDTTRACLISLRDNTLYPHDVYIMDGASVDNTVSRTRDLFPHVGVLELDRPYWVSYAWNRILEHALKRDYDYIGILNNDLLFHAGWLKHVLRCFIDDPDIGYAGPVHETRGGNLREMGKNRYGHFDEVLHWDPKEINMMPVVWLPGACIILRREAILDVGMFDEGFHFSDDEVDYCIRLWMNGWKVVANADSRIIHLVSVTISQHGGHLGKRAVDLKENYGVTYNRPKEYFYSKYTVPQLDAIMETISPEQDQVKSLTRRAVRIWNPAV